MLETWLDLDIEVETAKRVKDIITLKDVNLAVIFYHVAAYTMFENYEPYLDEDTWKELCDFITQYDFLLAPNIQRTIDLRDISRYDCCLVPCGEDEDYTEGVHYLKQIPIYKEIFEEGFIIEGFVESWIEVE